MCLANLITGKLTCLTLFIKILFFAEILVLFSIFTILLQHAGRLFFVLMRKLNIVEKTLDADDVFVN